MGKPDKPEPDKKPEPAKPQPSRLDEAPRVIEGYVADLREIIRQLRQRLLH
jgi:hypothetical protein